MDDLMAIGEFSERSGLSPKRLRTYAAEGLLVPAAIDPRSGYRYYSPDQLTDAQAIDALRRADVPLADIRAFMGQPCRERLDAWERQLRADADHRQSALALARQLLSVSEDPAFAVSHPPTEERLMTTLLTAGRTDIGRRRESNEDAVVTSDRLALVADGMGGHPGGEIAASAAARVVPAVFTGRSVDELEAAVRAANWAIRDHAASRPELEGMGTTICALGVLANGHVALVNVGDSRAYLWRQGDLKQLTRDHTLTAALVERGELQEDDVVRHPHFGVLTRALGVGPDVEIDGRTLAVEQGDQIILCSDGLFNELSGAEIANVVALGGGPVAIVDNLIDGANARGGRDNVSAVVAVVAS